MQTHTHSLATKNPGCNPLQCGAKTRSGHPCRTKPMSNGRCRMHGGTNPGAGPGNQNSLGHRNALKHGIYSRDIADLPTVHLNAIKNQIGTLDAELVITRVQLCRALAAQEKSDEQLELVETIDREGAGRGIAAKETVFRRVEYWRVIDRLLGRIESLEKARADLNEKTGTSHGDIVGNMARQDIFIQPDEAGPENPIL